MSRIFLVDNYNNDEREITDMASSWFEVNGNVRISYHHRIVNGKSVPDVYQVLHTNSRVEVRR